MTKKKEKKRSHHKKVNSTPTKKRRIPRQEVLPGVGDVKIAAIENAALDYAEIRDDRQELTKKEVDLKKRLHEAKVVWWDDARDTTFIGDAF